MRKDQFAKDETEFFGKYNSSLRDTLYQSYKPALAVTVILLVVGFFGRTVMLSIGNWMGWWADTLCIRDNGPEKCHVPPDFVLQMDTNQILLICGICVGIGFLTTLLFRVGISRLSAAAMSRLYDETTFRTSRLPMQFFDNNPSGRVMTRFSSDYNNIFRIFGGPLAEFLTLIFDLVAITFLVAIASPWFLIAWAIQTVLSFGVYKYFLPKLRRSRRDLARSRSPAISHFSESVNGVSSIFAYGKGTSFFERFRIFNDEFLKNKKSNVYWFAAFSIAMSAVTSITFLCICLLSVYLVSHGLVGIGSVGVAMAYTMMSAHLILSVFDWVAQFEEALTSIERMNEYLRSPIEPGVMLPQQTQFVIPENNAPTAGIWANKENLGRTAKPAGSIGIRFDQVTLRYRPELKPALDSLSLEIAPGECVAVVGKTGSGKSSLLQALFHLYPIEGGTIWIGDETADVKIPGVVDHLRSLMSYISQDPAVFTGTVRSNLDPSGALSEQELIGSLRKVQYLHTTATDLDYQQLLSQTIVEKGANLSVGERQLICIARCLLRNTPIVVFDEATSSVDPRSEEIITAATKDYFKGKTQIIIAHRLSTIAHCDRVIKMDSGKLVSV
jgi:ABC-type multidrug transport system fused ATPase/permease subunit